MKVAFKRDPLAKWPVLQRRNETGKCSDIPSACWQKSKGFEARGINGNLIKTKLVSSILRTVVV